MTHTITIAGKPFNVEPRYSEGSVLTANEASALNQTFFENLRNNFATKAKEGEGQEAFDAYASSYQFGVRTGGGGSRDPIQTEAMNLARDAVRALIKKSGKNISDYTGAAITAAATKLLENDPSYLELAKKRVEELQSAATSAISDDLMAQLNAAPAPTPAASAETASSEPASEEPASTGRRGRS